MEVFAAVYDRGLNVVRDTAPVVVDDQSFADLLDKHPVYFFGNGAGKCEGVIEHPNAHFIEGIKPVAKNMMPLAERAHAMGEFEDVAYFEPFYLKDFIAVKSTKVDKIMKG
jgi:tRNA threonylcarbamoyladenosine biosynthesis protein TsaB